MSFCKYAHKRFMEYFQNETYIEEGQSFCRLYLPFKNPDNDEIYINIIQNKNSKGGYISDNGQCIQFLYLNGINVEGENKYMKIFYDLLKEFEFQFIDGVIQKATDEKSVHFDIMDLIQLMNEAYGIASIEEGQEEEVDFLSIVCSFLDTKQIQHQRNLVIAGATIDHTIDISMNHRDKPTYIKTISTKRSGVALRNSELVSFTFLDLKNAQLNFMGVALLDDKYRVWDEKPIKVLKAYADKIIRWSNKEELELLATA